MCHRRQPVVTPGRARRAGPPPDGWPADLPAPEAPAGADAKDADEVAEATGPYAAAALASAAWQLREAGALWLERCLLPDARAAPSRPLAASRTAFALLSAP